VLSGGSQAVFREISKRKNDSHQSSARDPSDGTRSLTAFEMTSRRCHFGEHSEEQSPGFSPEYHPEKNQLNLGGHQQRKWAKEESWPLDC
jgi:hypothetical protein